MDPLYRSIILEHCEHPQNYGIIAEADSDVTYANPLCGDEIRMTMRIINDSIADIKCIVQGCAIAKASTSLLTDMVKGKCVCDAYDLTSHDMLDALGVELTPARLKCALLGCTTLKKSLASKYQPR